MARTALLAIGVGVAADVAAEHSGVARWSCWYAPDELSLRCLLTRPPDALVKAQAERAARTIDARLPALVRVIRGDPGELAGRQVAVPLWSPPTDMEFARQLADAVMCGSSAHCQVRFDENADGRAAFRAAAAIGVADEEDLVGAIASRAPDGTLAPAHDDGADAPPWAAPVQLAATEEKPRRRRRAG